ncbi:hypothetical protein B0H14DRAFT_3722265 [Mycena olivaceomarginata]|nr:hypothetical protein B0H14DRAFT_3722265 [Mycena olivaceomarginata]
MSESAPGSSFRPWRESVLRCGRFPVIEDKFLNMVDSSVKVAERHGQEESARVAGVDIIDARLAILMCGHHACAHVIPDIEDKGPPAGYSTRPGEGFHQEVKEAFNQTNFKNTDPQLTRIDENKEAFARIRMAIDEYDALHSVAQEEDDMFDEDASDVQWTLGSPLKWTTAEQLQQDLKDKNFAAKLRVFLNDFVVDPPLQPHDMIEPEDLTVAHLVQLLRCRLPDKSLHDIAVVRMLKPSKWVPKTKWAGCRVYDEEKALSFVMAKYLIRGAHMIPVFEASKPSLTFLNDLIDGDMFLRADN